MSRQNTESVELEPSSKHEVKLGAKSEEKTSKMLEDAIRDIYNNNASGLDFAMLYRRAPFAFIRVSSCFGNQIVLFFPFSGYIVEHSVKA
jgi:hypothetical protein